MDAGATETMWSPLVLALIGIAIAACIFGMISMVRAWRVSASHPPFAALGWKRWLIGAALPYMPEAATVHLKRHFFSMLTMAACLLALIVILWSGRAY
jgi:uncharacterized membrane protein